MAEIEEEREMEQDSGRNPHRRKVKMDDDDAIDTAEAAAATEEENKPKKRGERECGSIEII